METVQATSGVQVDDEDSQSDPSFGEEDIFSTSNTITSSVRKFEWKYGRRYHSYQAGRYSFPNDDTEQDRLDMIHHVYYRLLEDRLFLAPIEPAGLNVLDIGTGTGIWAIQFGDEHPLSKIVGNDLSPIQPDWVPPNVKFVVDDIEMDWVEPIQYDYIHCRYMAGSIKDWPRLFKQAYANLKPGGWVEFQETANTLYSDDGTLTPENPMLKMMEYLLLACDKIGRTMDPAPYFGQWAAEVGFTELREERFKLPIGTWPKDLRLKEIGNLMRANFHEGVGAFTAVLCTEVLGWSREEIEVFNASVREASRQRSVHPVLDFVVLTGRKPG